MALSGTLQFISASEYGVKYLASAGTTLSPHNRGAIDDKGFIPVDFVGMNLIIHEPFTSSVGHLGYDTGAPDLRYVAMSGGVGSPYTPFVDLRAANTNPPPNINTIEDSAILFNALMLHRNGAYGYPSWKQIRTGDHPVARFQRKNSAFSIIDPPQKPKKIITGELFYGKPQVDINLTDPLTGEIIDKVVIQQQLKGLDVPFKADRINFRQPSVVSAYKPMKHQVTFGPENAETAIIIHSYQNMIERITNPIVKDKLNLKDHYNEEHTIYNKLMLGFTDPSHTPINFKKLSIGQTIFPTKNNMYSAYARKRLLYNEPAGYGSETAQTGEGNDKALYRTFWRDKQNDRARTDNAALNKLSTVQSTGAIGGPIFAIAQLSGGSAQNVKLDDGDDDNSAADYDIITYIYQSQQYGYSYAATSKWLLDPRKDVFNIGSSPGQGMFYNNYLVGGIGATPNSPNENAAVSASLGWTSESVASLDVIRDAVFQGMAQVPNVAGMVMSASQMGLSSKPDNIAGGLVYNTAPTIFFLSASSAHQVSSTFNIGATDKYGSSFAVTAAAGLPYGNLSYANDGRQIGYRTATASMLYQMHNYPWRQPFWAVDKVIGRGPFYDNYNQYSEQLKQIAQGYSLVPEFKISKHMQPLQVTNFSLEGYEYPFLTLDGHILSTSILKDTFKPIASKKYKPPTAINPAWENQNNKDEKKESTHTKTFFKTFSHSDFITNLVKITSDADAVGANGNTSIVLTCKAIKKLLPYDGFYPAQRLAQIGHLFSQSISPYLLESGSSDMPSNLGDAGKLQTILEPYFAPGIAFNSIKSGLAVDWPLFTGSVSTLSATINFSSGSGQPSNRGEYVTNDAAAPYIINQQPDIRLPFEALFNLAKLKPILTSGSNQESLYPDKHTGHIVLPNVYRPQNLNVGGYGINKSGVTYEPNVTLKKSFHSELNFAATLYEKAMHNFLAESVRFFLDKRSLRRHVSKPRTKPMFKGIKYYMDVVLYQGKHQIMAEGPREEYNGGADKYLTDHIGGKALKLTNNGNDNRFLAVNVSTKRAIKKQLNVNHSNTGSAHPEKEKMLRGCIYGHPIFSSSDTGRLDVSASQRLRDPAYAAYTPPYFYGASKYTVVFDPALHMEAGQFFKDFSVDFVRQQCELDGLSYHKEMYETGKTNEQGNFSVTTMLNSKEKQSVLAKSRMKIDSSIELFGVAKSLKQLHTPYGNDYVGAIPTTTTNEEESRWVIHPRWECPVLDFSGNMQSTPGFHGDNLNNVLIDDLDGKELSVPNIYHNGETGKGMWSGYGQDPYQYRVMSGVAGLAADLGVLGSPEINALQHKGVYLSLEENPSLNMDFKLIQNSKAAQGHLIMPVQHPTGTFVGSTVRISDGTTTKIFEFMGPPRHDPTGADRLTFHDGVDQNTGHIIVPIEDTVGGTMTQLLKAVTGTHGPAVYPYSTRLQIDGYLRNLNDFYPYEDALAAATFTLSGAILVLENTTVGTKGNQKIIINSDVSGSAIGTPPINPFSTTGYFLNDEGVPGTLGATNAKNTNEDLSKKYWEENQDLYNKWETINPDLYANSSSYAVVGMRGGVNLTAGIKVPNGEGGEELVTETDKWMQFLGNSRAPVGPRASLLDACGFEAKTEPIGKVAESLEISEAIVCVPFITEFKQGVTLTETAPWGTPPMYLYGISPDKISKVLHGMIHGTGGPNANQLGITESKLTEMKNSPIGEMIRKMRKFVIPPHLDFIGQTLRGGSKTNESGIPSDWDFSKGLAISPFPMVIFEFNHTLQKQELMDIWQGVMPYSAMRSVMDTSQVTITPGKGEFNLLSNFGTGQYEQQYKTGNALPSNTKWCVFKVKQRADNNYYNLLPEFDGMSNIANNAAYQINPHDTQKDFFEPRGHKQTYSYNWPYDYFSLLELVKLDKEIILEK
jgi:hypothetical protein